MTTKTALVLLAEGAEEMEVVITVDVLRRAKIDVILAGLVDDFNVKCSRGVNIRADKHLRDLKDNLYDVVVLPGGGKGSQNLSSSSDVKEVLKRHHAVGNLIAAICAAPTVLAAHDIGKGKKLTSYPAMKEKLGEYSYSEDRVVKDGNILTSRGPGTAFEFALEIVSILVGSGTANDLKEEMIL